MRCVERTRRRFMLEADANNAKAALDEELNRCAQLVAGAYDRLERMLIFSELAISVTICESSMPLHLHSYAHGNIDW